MATIIQMFCPECDYSTELLRFGVVVSDRRTLGPALDADRREIVEIDYDSHHDHHVVPYTNEHLRRPASESEVLESFPYRLSRKHNFCPSCNGYSLNIEEFGLV